MKTKILLLMIHLLVLLTVLGDPAMAALSPVYSGDGGAILEIGDVPVASVASFDSAQALVSSKPAYGQPSNTVLDKQAPMEFSLVLTQSLNNRLFEILQRNLIESSNPLSGRVIFKDPYGRVSQVFIFSEAVLTEAAFSALDVKAKERFTLGLKFKAGVAKWGDPKTAANHSSPVEDRQMQWLAANFRLDIDGLDSRVSRIEPFTLVRKPAQDAGECRSWGGCADDDLELPTLTVTLLEHDGELSDWYEALRTSADQEAAERSGTLTLLTADQTKTLFSVRLDHLGIYLIAYDLLGASHDQGRKVTAGLYVNGWRFAAGTP